MPEISTSTFIGIRTYSFSYIIRISSSKFFFLSLSATACTFDSFLSLSNIALFITLIIFPFLFSFFDCQLTLLSLIKRHNLYHLLHYTITENKTFIIKQSVYFF